MISHRNEKSSFLKRKERDFGPLFTKKNGSWKKRGHQDGGKRRAERIGVKAKYQLERTKCEAYPGGGVFGEGRKIIRSLTLLKNGKREKRSS